MRNERARGAFTLGCLLAFCLPSVASALDPSDAFAAIAADLPTQVYQVILWVSPVALVFLGIAATATVVSILRGFWS